MRQVKTSLYLCIFFIFTATSIFAKDTPFTTSVSFVGMSMDYTEYDLNGKFLDSEESSYLDVTGVEIGIGYTLSQDISSSSEVKFNFMILGGETKYKGFYIATGLPASSVTQNTIIDTDISYQRSNRFNNGIELCYGIGLGYREWERALSASQVEVYSWYSLRPMIGVNTNITDVLNIGLLVEYQYGFETKMSESSLNHTFTLGGADILEISLPFSYEYNKDLDLFFEATFQKQMITKSDRLYTGNGNEYWYEPESTAYNSYLKIGVAYSF